MQPNFQVGQYVLERSLGEGGMAEVWLARNVHIGNLAAVKFLNNDYAGKPDIEQRFINEGRRQGALSHPNIIKVYGFEYVEGRSFLILQYVDGEPLGDLLDRAGRLEVSEALRIGISVLNALDYSHEENIVHRDIKPSNILLDKHGFPYLGDFGIVRALNAQSGTMTGMVMGTSLYMSPEQFKSPKAVDGRSDIYSFGCMLYQMLAGVPPFNPPDSGDEGWFVAVMLAHLQEPPTPLRSRNPAVSAGIEDVVMRCLAKKPEERYARCRDVRDALNAAMVGRPSAPRQQTVVEIPAPAIGKGPVAGATRVNPRDGLTYLWMPPGSFIMGCSGGDKHCAGNEEPAHEVTITRGFWIGPTLVMQEAFRRVMGRDPSHFKGLTRPVESVTWLEALEYCQVVGMRLPTEAEWEYAARSGSPKPCYGPVDAVAWHSENSHDETHDVGKKQPNRSGLCDTLGNVWEWTADWYDARSYPSSPAVDPTVPSEGKHRVSRGGCWVDAAWRVRVSARRSLEPGARNNFVGFRCAGD